MSQSGREMKRRMRREIISTRISSCIDEGLDLRSSSLEAKQ